MSRRDDPPLLIKILIGYFLAKPEERLQSKGIFRITSKWEQIKEIEAHLNNGDYEVIEHAKQPQDIANLLKYTLKYLRIPLFPYKQYFDMGKQRVMDEAKRVEQVKGILAELKQTENGLQAYNTLKLIFLFFKEVDRNEPQNKMSAKNLSVTNSPYLFQAPKGVQAPLFDGMKPYYESFVYMIEHCDEIFLSSE